MLDQEIIDEFVVECRDGLAEIEAVLTSSAAADIVRDDIDAIFRSFHSMKGTAGFLGFENVVEVTHKAESLLQVVRDADASLEEPHVDLLCQAVDFCTEALEQVEGAGNDHAMADDAPPLVANLLKETAATERRLAGEDPAAAPDEASTEASTHDARATAPASNVEFFDPPSPAASKPASNVEFFDPPSPAASKPASNVETFDARSAAPEIAAPPDAPSQGAAVTPPPAEAAGATESGVAAPKRSAKTKREPKKREPKKPAQESVRVDVAKLDSLMNLVGELILAETMVTQNQDLVGHEFENFQKAALQLNRVTRALQDTVMSVRMLPLRNTLRKLNRIVRDVASKQGKNVRLTIRGEETEVDKNLIEGIGDPLVHIIRNSVDHGVESAEDRRAAGKPEQGEVLVEAKQEGSEVWVVIKDDGKGLDRDKILARAIERGLVDGDGSDWPDGEVFGLIFAPGFSTAEKVTDVSGRGVGMDVVRRNIEALRGRVDIASTKGQGTTITLRIPLTLAIIDGMLVRVGATTYTIPVLAIESSLKADETLVMELPDGSRAVDVRGTYLPLVELEDLHEDDGVAPQSERDTFVVVVSGERRACVRVNSILGQRQTVIKALPKFLGHLKTVSGCSIRTDGDISLIVDVTGLLSSYALRPDVGRAAA